jgi:hypothetical protein
MVSAREKSNRDARVRRLKKNWTRAFISQLRRQTILLVQPIDDWGAVLARVLAAK